MNTLGLPRMVRSHTVASALALAVTATLTSVAAGHATTAAPTATSHPASHPGHHTREPLVIGHRGAAGYRPEHTLESYRLAISMGADFVEPDLVSTKDGVLVARHENEIGGTTDVADHPEFAGRKTTKTVDGKPVTGWFTEDFTLAELKTLRAKERLPLVRPANTAFDKKFEVPTFDEVLSFVQHEERVYHRRIGVYPETKHPTYFRSIGLPLEGRLLAALRRHHLDRRGSKVFIQSFETSNLRALHRKTRLPLIQLLDSSGAPYDLTAKGDPRTYADLTAPRQLRWIASYATGIGPNKDLVLPRNADGYLTRPSAVVADAHRAGLIVHIFTLRRENQFMAKDFQKGTDPNAVGDFEAEAKAFLDTGIDGAFTDNSDLLVKARENWEKGQQRPAA